MELILAQSTELAADAGRLLGLTVIEWGVLLGFLASFVGALVKHIQASKGARKVAAVVHALEEAQEKHPEAVKLAKRLARAKATSFGVELGPFGLAADVERITERMKRRKVTPTPDPEVDP